jgi:hypothetical protein
MNGSVRQHGFGFAWSAVFEGKLQQVWRLGDEDLNDRELKSLLLLSFKRHRRLV